MAICDDRELLTTADTAPVHRLCKPRRDRTRWSNLRLWPGHLRAFVETCQLAGIAASTGIEGFKRSLDGFEGLPEDVGVDKL